MKFKRCSTYVKVNLEYVPKTVCTSLDVLIYESANCTKKFCTILPVIIAPGEL